MAEYGDKHRDRRFDDGDFWHLPKPDRTPAEPREAHPVDLPAVGTAGNDAGGTESGNPATPAFAIPERKTPAPVGADRFPNVFVRQSYAGRGGRRASASSGTPRTALGTPNAADLVVSYEPENVLIHKVSVYRWPNKYHFYEKFIRNAHLSHAAVGHECPRVPFFSYIPQYSQLTRSQAHYYFWFRDNAREGRYLEADVSYVLLYVYEIINLPDEIEPRRGAVLLCRLWNAYRKTHRELDKYLSEWLADYCLIHAIPLPAEAAPLIPAAVRCSTLPEFYFSAGMTGDDLSDFAAALIAAASDYDCKTSRYYDGFRDDFDRAIPAAVTAAVTAMKKSASGIFSPEATKTIRQSRDAFCGSLCEHNVKRRIDVELSSLARSHGLRAAVTATVKYAENRLRSAMHLKSRLAATGLPDDARLAIDAYFAAAYPGSVTPGETTPAYEAYYDVPDTPFTPEAAREIEARSWEMTALLEGGLGEAAPAGSSFPTPAESPSPTPAGSPSPTPAESPSPTPAESPFSTPAETPFPVPAEDASPSFASFAAEATPVGQAATIPPETASAASAKETPETENNGTPRDLVREALRAALSGEGIDGYCRARDLFPDEVASRVNEAAFDRIGDVVLEKTGSVWVLIEDYREDVSSWSNT